MGTKREDFERENTRERDWAAARRMSAATVWRREGNSTTLRIGSSTSIANSKTVPKQRDEVNRFGPNLITDSSKVNPTPPNTFSTVLGFL